MKTAQPLPSDHDRYSRYGNYMRARSNGRQVCECMSYSEYSEMMDLYMVKAYLGYGFLQYPTLLGDQICERLEILEEKYRGVATKYK